MYMNYDLHEVNFELLALGLNEYQYFNKCSIRMSYGRSIEIIDLKIDEKKSNYIFKFSVLKFDIHLKNLESNKIFIKYKESPLNLTEEEKKEEAFIDLIILKYQKIYMSKKQYLL